MATWNRDFFKGTVERVIGTAAATAITVLSVADPFAIDWQQGAVMTGIASAVTFLKCVVANAATGDGPGFGQAEQLSTKGDVA
jgi:hypothetical protein